MKKAVVTKAFSGRPDKETHSRQHNVGDVLEGELARVALEEKWAEMKEVEDETPPEEEDNSTGGRKRGKK